MQTKRGTAEDEPGNSPRSGRECGTRDRQPRRARELKHSSNVTRGGKGPSFRARRYKTLSYKQTSQKSWRVEALKTSHSRGAKKRSAEPKENLSKKGKKGRLAPLPGRSFARCTPGRRSTGRPFSFPRAARRRTQSRRRFRTCGSRSRARLHRKRGRPILLDVKRRRRTNKT